jgi:endonuclease/exonuclease/phosphatase family metal-dependent hydrolase
MRPFHASTHSAFHSTQHPSDVLKVATYNIHKGVRGVGPRRRLEIHNLVLGIEAFDSDLVFLQEVRRMNRAAARHFPETHVGWPRLPQADYLAP